jgi:RNA polymerase sigma-70 factor (ECF subfamily)
VSQVAEWSPERYRPLLRLQARQLRLTPRFERRFDSSDLVQETLLRAHRNRDQFRGRTETESLAWLHEVLLHVAADEVRKARAQKRDVALEQSLEALAADSSARWEKCLAGGELSPEAQAERREQLLRVSAAIEDLPDDQRDAVVLRELMGLPVAEVAARMGRTEKAVAGLLLRGREKLREMLAEEALAIRRRLYPPQGIPRRAPRPGHKPQQPGRLAEGAGGVRQGRALLPGRPGHVRRPPARLRRPQSRGRSP